MIEITQINMKMKQGVTCPYRCGADDSASYVVKGRQTTIAGLVTEWVVANVGIAFGLPIPNPELAYLDESTVELHTEAADSLGHGMVFASKYQENMQEISYSALAKAPQGTLKDLLVFDFWIQNSDRTLSEEGGNPNLLYEPVDKAVWAMDHNLAFDPDFDTSKFSKSHVGRFAWKNSPPDMYTHQYYEQKIEVALQALDGIIEQIPEEWTEELSELGSSHINDIQLRLRSFNYADLEEALNEICM